MRLSTPLGPTPIGERRLSRLFQFEVKLRSAVSSSSSITAPHRLRVCGCGSLAHIASSAAKFKFGSVFEFLRSRLSTNKKIRSSSWRFPLILWFIEENICIKGKRKEKGRQAFRLKCQAGCSLASSPVSQPPDWAEAKPQARLPRSPGGRSRAV